MNPNQVLYYEEYSFELTEEDVLRGFIIEDDDIDIHEAYRNGELNICV